MMKLRKSKRRIDEIIIHCSATQEGKQYHASDIERWHKARGFNGVGYHYIVCLDGSVENGRDVNQLGAHCLGRNSNSIGICYIGGLDVDGKPCDTRTPEQRASLLQLLRELRKLYPTASIHGHNEYAKKACPCFNASKEYISI